MRRTSIQSLVVLLLLLIQTGLGAEASRLELKDGTVYENVSYDVDDTYKVIYVVLGNTEKTVSFTLVARILGPGGVDVSEEVLGEYYSPEVPDNLRDDGSDVPSSGGAGDDVPESSQGTIRDLTPGKLHPFTVGFGFGGNYGLGMGDWYEGTRGGVGFHAEMMINVARRIAIRLSVSRAGLRHDPDELFGGTPVFQDDLDFQVWRYFISAQYYNWPGWRTGGQLMTYVYSGLGAVTHKLTGRAIVAGDVPDEIWIYEGTGETETKLAGTFGGGIVLIPVGRVGFNLEGEFDYVFVDSDDGSGSWAAAGIFDIRLGIILFVG